MVRPSQPAAFTFIVEDVTVGRVRRHRPDGAQRHDDAATVKVDKKLNSATASGTVSGTEETYHSGTERRRHRRRHARRLPQPPATGGSSVRKTHNVTKNPDGSTDTFNETVTDKLPGGTFTMLTAALRRRGPLVSVVEHDVYATLDQGWQAQAS